MSKTNIPSYDELVAIKKQQIDAQSIPIQSSTKLPTYDELLALKNSTNIPIQEDDSSLIDSAKGLGYGLVEGATGGLLNIGHGVAGAITAKLAEIGEPGVSDETISKLRALKEKGFNVEVPETGLKDLINKYYEAKESGKKLGEEIHDKAPIANTIGNVGGMALGLGKLAKPIESAALASKGLAGLKANSLGSKVISGAISGGALGAAESIGRGDAELLRGDIVDSVKEGAYGGTFGAATGAVVPAIAEVGKQFIGSVLKGSGAKTGYEAGRETGKALTFKSQGLAEAEAAKNFMEDINNEIMNKYKISGDTLRKAAEEAGERIKIGEPVDEALNKVIDRKIFSEHDVAYKDKKEIYDYLKSLVVPQEKMLRQKGQEEITSDILKKTIKNQNLDEQAALAMQKKSAEEMALVGQLPKEVVEYKVPMDFDSVNGRPNNVLVQQIEKTGRNLETGVPETTFSSKSTDVTGFKPSNIEEIIDPNSGKSFQLYKNEATGKVEKIVESKPKFGITEPSPTGYSPFEIKSLIKNIEQKTKLGDDAIQDPELQKIVLELKNALRTLDDNMLEKYGKEIGVDLKELRHGFTRAKSGLEALGVPEQFIQTGDQAIDQQIEQQMHIARKIREQGENAIATRKEAFRRIGDSVPGQQIAAKHEPIFEKLNKYRSLIGGLPEESQAGGSLNPKAVFGSVKGIIGRTASKVGATVTNAENVLKVGYNNLLKANSNQLTNTAQQIINKHGQKAADFSKMLMKASTSQESQRNLILYNLFSQPAFREMLKDDEENNM